jgi:hypothetical protein
MRDSDRVIAQAEALLRRVSPEARRLAQRARARRWQSWARRILRVALAVFAIAIGAGVYGLAIAPLGFLGIMLAFAAMVLAAGLILFWPGEATPTPQALVQTDLAQLPLRTEQWLERQRPALPAPAARLVDGIGLRLEALAPQLEGLDPREPAAIELRKLIAEELPELIDGYRRVPQAMRAKSDHGISPDNQLAEGLAVVDSELDRMTAQLASGDLNKLATQRRYLELKYRDESM